MPEDRVVYHIDGKPLADYSQVELEEWAARQRAMRAMREAGSGRPKKAKKASEPSAPKPAAEEM